MSFVQCVSHVLHMGKVRHQRPMGKFCPLEIIFALGNGPVSSSLVMVLVLKPLKRGMGLCLLLQF